MDNITTDYLISLSDMSEDSLFELYTEAMNKLKSKDTSQFDRKIFVMRVMMIRSLITDKYSLRAYRSNRSGIETDNPMNNPQVNRFFK